MFMMILRHVHCTTHPIIISFIMSVCSVECEEIHKKIYTFNFFNTHPHHHKQNKPRGTRIITGCRVVSHIKSFSSHSNCKKTKSLKTRSNLARSAFTHLAVLTKGPLNNTNKKQDNSYNFQNILENNIPILNSFYSKNPKNVHLLSLLHPISHKAT